MGSDLLARFEKYIIESTLFTKQSKILVAVSGGVDSMVLMSLLVRAGYNVAVAHCNFQLRGKESDEDEQMVEKAVNRYNIPLYNVRFDTYAEMERTGESVQLAARRLRYTWFNELCRTEGYNAIAIAHQAEDSIETFLINMLRGTGLQGLTGIRVINDLIVRPLLFASRKDILDYSATNNIEYREDSSNRSTQYLRNKIRLGIVPLLKEMRPGFTKIMGANLKRLTDTQRFIDHAVELIRQQVEHRQGDMIVIDPSKIDSDFPHNFVIYELLKEYGFSGDVIDSLCVAMSTGLSGKRVYSHEYAAYVDRERIIVTRIEDGDTCDTTIEAHSHRVHCGNTVIYIERAEIYELETLVTPENIALLDADKLTFPLKLRLWREGDSFIPLGMRGNKKVSDFLIDNKVSVPEKKRQFVVLNGEDIVWIVGRRIDDRYKITDDTEKVLKMELTHTSN